MPWGGRGAEGPRSSVGASGGDQTWGREWLYSVGGSLTLFARSPLCVTDGGLDGAIGSRDFWFLLTVTN